MAQINLMELPAFSITALLLALFVAGATKGLIGVGMPIVAVPILTLVVDLPVVVGLLSIPLIITKMPPRPSKAIARWLCCGQRRFSAD